MYIPKYFKPYELVPENIYYEFFDNEEGINPNFWYLFDSRMLLTADWLRGRWGKIIVNTWYWGGGSQYRGLRPQLIDIGVEWSQHKFGRALDCVFVESNVDEVRTDILENTSSHDYCEYITAVELGVDWLHFDTRNWDKSNGIFTFSQ